MRIIEINAKCNDCCMIGFSDTDDDTALTKTKHGYVPRNLGIGGGDYIKIKIDADSGEIIGWDFPDNETISEEMDKM